MRRSLPLFAALGISMLAAADQPFDIEPGLWKFHITLDAGNGAHTITSDTCITAEDLRNTRVLQLAANRGRACSSQVTHQSTSVLEGVIECAAAGGVSRTQVSYKASGRRKLEGSMHAVGADSRQGAQAAITAEWSAAACPRTEEDDFEGEED